MTIPSSFDFSPADYDPLYRLMTRLSTGLMLYPTEVINAASYPLDHDPAVLNHQSAGSKLGRSAARFVGRMAGHTRNATVSTIRFFARPETKASFLIGHWAAVSSAIAILLLALNSWAWTIALLAFYFYLTAALFDSIARLG